MKIFALTGVAPDDGIPVEAETGHGAPTHAVCIRYRGIDKLEITYFTGRSSVRKTVAGTCAMMIVMDPERLGLDDMASKREGTPGDGADGG